MPHWKDVTNDWIKSVMREFYLYFRFPDGKQLLGEKISKGYMKGNWSKWHYHWRRAALKAAGIRGNRDYNERIRAHKPGWCSEDVWDKLCNHWANSDFKNTSNQRKGARLASKMTHTGGSMPFEQHEKDLAEELKSQPTHTDLFERTHKRKSKEGQRGKGPWIREHAENIYKNYNDLFPLPSSSDLSENTPTQEKRMQAQLHAYLKAVGGVRKNRIIRMPRVPAYTIVPTAYSQARDAASSSRSGPHVDHDALQLVMDGVIKKLFTNIPQPPPRNEINLRIQEFIHGSTAPQDEEPDELGQKIETGVIRVLATLLGKCSSGHYKSVCIQS